MSLCGKSRARSAETRNQRATAFGQRCSNRNGQAICGEFSTSSTVIGVLKETSQNPTDRLLRTLLLSVLAESS
jgi:hypothetical protein